MNLTTRSSVLLAIMTLLLILLSVVLSILGLIDAINLFGDTVFATAFLGAVFVFLFPVSYSIHTNKQLNIELIPTIISVPKEVL